MVKMKIFRKKTRIAILSILFLIIASTPLYAASSRSISASCTVLPRIAVEMEPTEASTESQAHLLQQKGSKAEGLPFGYTTAIVYSYCAR